MFVSLTVSSCLRCFFFFNDTATTEIYTLSLHDALPICVLDGDGRLADTAESLQGAWQGIAWDHHGDRKSTRLNSSHSSISYAVFCLKKKKTKKIPEHMQTKQKAHQISI